MAATSSFAAQNALVSASYNRETQIISTGLKLALANTLRPEFKELVWSVYYKDKVEQKVVSRSEILGIIAKVSTSTEFTLSMSFDKSGFVGLVQIKERYANATQTIVIENELGSQYVPFLARPDPPRMSLLNIGRITNNGTDSSKLDLNGVSFTIELNGNNGGNPFAAYSAYYTVVNTNGSVTGPISIGNNVAIQSADFHLMVETHFDQRSFTGQFEFDRKFGPSSITEKAYKAIACSRPFITFATPYFLEDLRNLGYKTFSPYIDESYDTEVDNVKRLNLIVAEVQRICKLSDDDYSQLVANCRSIAEFNQTYFKNRKNSRHDT